VVRSQYEAIKYDTDQALKAAGLRERTTAEQLANSFNSAWHDLGVSLGFSEPTLLEKLSGATTPHRRGSLSQAWDAVSLQSIRSPHTDNMLRGRALHMHRRLLLFPPSQTLKSLNLRDKTAMDKARDAFDSAIHKTKVLLHAEEPTVAEKVNAALAEARTRADALANALSSSLPSSGEMTEAARSQYHQALAAARSQFETIKHDTDQALKAAGLRERTTAEQLANSFNSAWHDLGVSLGFSEPTLMEKMDAATTTHRRGSLSQAWDAVSL
jgi:hypothetical protein